MSMECQVNVKSQSELDIGGRETCFFLSLEKYGLNMASLSSLDSVYQDDPHTNYSIQGPKIMAYCS